MKAGLTRYQKMQTREANGREPIPHGEHSSADIELGRRMEAQLIAEALRAASAQFQKEQRAGGLPLPASIVELLS